MQRSPAEFQIRLGVERNFVKSPLSRFLDGVGWCPSNKRDSGEGRGYSEGNASELTIKNPSSYGKVSKGGVR